MPSFTLTLSDEAYGKLLELIDKLKKEKSEIIQDLILNSGKR